MRRVFLFALLLGCDGAADPPPHGGRKHEWSSFPDGAWVRYRLVRAEPRRTMTFDEVWTVVSRDEVKLNLEVRLTIEGKTDAPDARSIALADLRSFRAQGSETLRLAGRDHECRVLEHEGSGGVLRTRRWESDAFPAWPVREEESGTDERGIRVVTETRLVDPDARQKLGDRELRCAVFESEMKKEGKILETSREWRSQEVPGHLVRKETMEPGSRAGTTQVALEFGAKKK